MSFQYSHRISPPMVSQRESKQQLVEEKDNPLLELSLSSDEHRHPRQLQLQLRPQRNLINTNQHSDRRVYSCNHCRRKFYSAQALGGHQNAHKRERSINKRRQTSICSSNMPSSFPHLHASFNGSNGVQVHSAIHKHSIIHKPTSDFPSTYRQSGWSAEPVRIRQPTIGRLPMAPSISSAARFNHTGGGFKWDSTSLSKINNQDELQKIDLSLKL